MPRLSLSIVRRKITRESLLQRLQQCLQAPENATCADCADTESSWACLLKSETSKGGVRIGVFCCNKCCSYHYQLGRDICTVKNVKSGEDWTDEEVKAMETSGNALSNAIYEAECLDSVKKELRSLSGRNEENARQTFAIDKYKKKKFFDKNAYMKHAIWCEVYSNADSDQCDAHRKEITSTTRRQPNSTASSKSEKRHISSRNSSAENTSFSFADSSGLLDLSFEDKQADQDDLARVLAQRAMCSGGAIRRGSFNGGLLSRNRGSSTGRPRRDKSREVLERISQSHHENLHCTEKIDLGDETEATRKEARRARRRIGRTKSSDLAETGETSLQRRNSNRCLFDADDAEYHSEAESVGVDRKCRGRRKTNPLTTRLERRNSRRSLTKSQEEHPCKQPKSSTSALLEKRASRKSLVNAGDGGTSTGHVSRKYPEESSTTAAATSESNKLPQLASRMSTKSRCSSEEETGIHPSITDKESNDRKARRRSGRRRKELVNCDSPTSVQVSDTIGYGSVARSTGTSDGISGPRPRRRPSLNGTLALAIPQAPTLS